VKLGLPSKGRLQEATVATLAAAGIMVERTGSGREYAARAEGLPGLEIVLVSAGEIPKALAEGALHAGVTGEDLIRERADANPPALAKRLGFGRADLIVAVPAVWLDVETMHDLDEAAAAFRAAHGRPMRVATKYHNLARAFFAEKGVADYRLVDSQGATEAGPKNLTAEAIVDIASSGETLRANHLRPAGGRADPAERSLPLGLASAAAWDAEAERTLKALGARLGFDGG
jgi:ATP phosphoribosyltransferase